MRPQESPDTLHGGEWRSVDGVLRWVATEPVEGQALSVAGLLACPTCHARVDQTCRSAGGNPRVPHTTRLTPRLCPCGAALGPKRQMCEPCRGAARQQTYRLREQRRPTRTRRRAA